MTGVERGDVDRGSGVVPAERFPGCEEVTDHLADAVFEEVAHSYESDGQRVVANWARSSRHR